MHQNYPNPFNPTTTINFALLQRGRTKLIVYDLTGKEIATIIDGYKTAGSYSIKFDAQNLPSVVYFYKMISGGFKMVKKMVLIK